MVKLYHNDKHVSLTGQSTSLEVIANRTDTVLQKLINPMLGITVTGCRDELV